MRLLNRIRGLWKDERGITGLETSIMLIAFVVVASVFAFAVLQMGLFSQEKITETGGGAITEITSVLALRDTVVAHADELPTGEYVNSVRFAVRHQDDPVELSDQSVVVNYRKGDSCIPLQFGESGPQPGLSWDVDWINGGGPVLNDISAPAEIVLTLYGLRDKLDPSGGFSVAIKPKEAPSEPCIPPPIGDDSDVLLAGNVDLLDGELLADDSRVEFGLDYYDEEQDGGISAPDPITLQGRYVTHLTFMVHNASPSGTIDLSGESTVVSLDYGSTYHSNLPFHEDIANTPVGLSWGMLEDSGQEIEVQINLFGLKDLLGPEEEFTVVIRPPTGQPLTIEKKLPVKLETRNRLD